MENFELTAVEIGRSLTINQINQKLELFSVKYKKLLPETVYEKDEHLITLDLVPVENSPVNLPVAFRTKATKLVGYQMQSWKHEVNSGFFVNGQRVKIACAMCDLYFNASVPRLYDCLKSSMSHSLTNRIPLFVCITDRVMESFDRLPSGTVVVKTSKEYKKAKVELL